jgi:hypothetical protein
MSSRLLKKPSSGVLSCMNPSTYTLRTPRGSCSLRPCDGKGRVLARLGCGGCEEDFLSSLTAHSYLLGKSLNHVATE